MKVLRKIGQFELNEGDGMAKGQFNMTNEILVENTKDEGVSYWFDKDTRDILMMASKDEFISRAKQMCGNDINRFV
jgi:hypothetical protein